MTPESTKTRNTRTRVQVSPMITRAGSELIRDYKFLASHPDVYCNSVSEFSNLVIREFIDAKPWMETSWRWQISRASERMSGNTGCPQFNFMVSKDTELSLKNVTSRLIIEAEKAAWKQTLGNGEISFNDIAMRVNAKLALLQSKSNCLPSEIEATSWKYVRLHDDTVDAIMNVTKRRVSSLLSSQQKNGYVCKNISGFLLSAMTWATRGDSRFSRILKQSLRQR